MVVVTVAVVPDSVIPVTDFGEPPFAAVSVCPETGVAGDTGRSVIE